MKHHLPTTLSILLLSITMGPFSAGAQITVVADSFNTAKEDLEGTSAKTWDDKTYARAPKWRVTQGKAMSSDGHATTAEPGGATFNLATPDRTDGVLCLKVDAGLVREATDWIGLGFLSSPDAVFWGQPLVAVLARDGKVRLYQEATDDAFWISPAIPGFSWENIYPFEIRYDRAAGTVDILVDNEKLNDAPIELAPFSKDSTIGAVGVRIHANKEQEGDESGIATVDNFQFTVKPDVKKP